MGRKSACLLGAAAGALALSGAGRASETVTYTYDELGRLTAVATSGGAPGGNGSIAVSSLPETPIVGKKASPDAQAGPGASTATASVSGPGGKLTAPPPGRPVTIANGGGGGALVQLGSFPTEAGANAAWAQESKRFGYLANLGKSIEKAQVNGRTFYRLKVNAGSSGAALDPLCNLLNEVLPNVPTNIGAGLINVPSMGSGSGSSSSSQRPATNLGDLMLRRQR